MNLIIINRYFTIANIHKLYYNRSTYQVENYLLVPKNHLLLATNNLLPPTDNFLPKVNHGYISIYATVHYKFLMENYLLLSTNNLLPTANDIWSKPKIVPLVGDALCKEKFFNYIIILIIFNIRNFVEIWR